ncbi:MAG TPA: class I SAM-dependent methyltransferase [Hanamia sp.]
MLLKSIYRKLGKKYFDIRFKKAKKNNRKYNRELQVSEIKKLFPSLKDQHLYFHHYFWNLAPTWLKDHRAYFSKEKRAFGEDAFHAMWYHIFKKFKPKKALEIGVYRGSTLSLFSLLSQKFQLQTEVHGISPFTSAGDAVSKYLDNLDYYTDVKNNFDYFNLPSPFLHKGFSTEKAMLEIIQSQQWDLIYIDGNHDYEVAKQDFNLCSQYIRKGGLIVLDDSSLYTDFKPPFYSTAGHPGPSKVASEIDPNTFEEILSVGHNRVFKKI